MVAVKLEGRLGNQLFQYAFIYTASKKLNTKFYLDKSIDYLLLDKYFNIEQDLCYFFDKKVFSIKGFKNIFSHHLRYKFYYLLKQLFHLKIVTFYNSVEPLTQIKKIEDGTIYQGFFQSEDYFRDLKKEIKNIFTIKDIHVKKFKSIIDRLPITGKHVVVHIRKGDYVDCDFSLNYEYFHKAIVSLNNDANYFIFVSDEPAKIENEFKYIKNKYISDNEEIIDFQFIMHADICILSNSSFSWWGAYLNTKQPKIVAPRYWLGKADNKELPVNVIPHSWIKLD
jgi:hypothetical protein